MKNHLWKFIGFITVALLIVFIESSMNVTATNTHAATDNKVTLQHFVELELEDILFDVLEDEGNMPFVTIRNTSENDATGFTVVLIVISGTGEMIHASMESNLNAAPGGGVILPLGIRADSVPDGGYTLHIKVSHERLSWNWERRFQVEDGVWSEVEERGPPETLFWVILILLIAVAIIASRIRKKNSESNGL